MLEIGRKSETEISLWGEANLASAQELHSALAELLDAPGVTTIDLAGLTEIDLAGLQILAAFVMARGRERVAFSGWTEPVRRHVRLSGFDEWLPA